MERIVQIKLVLPLGCSGNFSPQRVTQREDRADSRRRKRVIQRKALREYREIQGLLSCGTPSTSAELLLLGQHFSVT